MSVDLFLGCESCNVQLHLGSKSVLSVCRHDLAEFIGMHEGIDCRVVVGSIDSPLWGAKAQALCGECRRPACCANHLHKRELCTPPAGYDPAAWKWAS